MTLVKKRTADSEKTLRWKIGKVWVTDGPYTEANERLGGVLLLEADNLQHAVQLMSKHPGVKSGPFEFRPAADLNAVIHATG